MPSGAHTDHGATWDSERRGVADYEEGDYEVDSTMLASEMQDLKNRGDRGKERWRSAAKRRRNAAVAMGAGVVLIIFLIVGGTTSSRWNAAATLSDSLAEDTTGSNDVGDWVPWTEALSQLYLHHTAPPAVDTSSDAEECAKHGWKPGCTHKVFHGTSAEERQLHVIEAARESLESAYAAAVAKVRPVTQRLRLPAGVALEYKRAVASAQKGVCEIPPTDDKCIAARTVEEKAVGALQATLRREARLRRFGRLDPKGDKMRTLQRVAGLIRKLNPVDTVTQNGWKEFNAVTAVVLRQTLQHVQERSGGYEDIMLYPSSPHIMYVGKFQELEFDGEGTLYYTSGQIAYRGGWRGGRMHGQGTLLNSDGSLAWDGEFDHGRPVQPWYAV